MKRSLFFTVVFIIILAITACSFDGPEDTGPTEPEPTAIANVPDISEDAAPVEEVPVEVPEISENEGIFATDAMVSDLDSYVLRPEDMPDPYKIPADNEQHLTNLRVINTVGEVKGKRYMAATSRLDGWSLGLERVNKEDLIPFKIYSQIEVFETAEGAQIAFGEDWLPVYQEPEDEANTPNWIEDGCDFGDACIMYYYKIFDPATELTTLQYEVTFVNKNTLVQVMGRGLDFDMKPDYIANAAEILLEKIDTAPMTE